MSTSIWKDSRFVAYTIGLMINSFGNALYMVALPLMVYSITHSAVAMSIMTVAEFLPRAIASLFIGSIVDRISRRVVIFAALSSQAVCSFLIAALFSADMLSINLLYVLGALISIGHEFARTAEFAIIPAMFKDRRVEANAGLNSAHTLMMISGPVMAAICLSWVDYSVLLWFNAITYFGPILLCIWTRIPHEKDLGGIRSPLQVTQDTVQGFKYLFSSRTLVDLFLITVVTGIADSGMMTVILFHLKHDLAASDTFTSFIFTINGIGLFLGSLLVPRFKNSPQGKVMFWGLFANNIGVLLFAVPVAWMLPVAQFLAAAGSVVFNVSKGVITQEAVSNEMMGRIGGTMRMMSSLTLSISTAMLGAIAGFAGAEAAVLTAAVLTFIPSYLIWKSPVYRFGASAPTVETVQPQPTTQEKRQLA